MEQSTRNISDIEADLIKSTFFENETLLKSMRALMLGLEVTNEEKETIKATFASDELLAIITKRFYPTLDKNTPIGQVQDVWLGAEQMVFGQPKEVGYQAVQYKQMALDMTKIALNLLTKPEGERVNLEYNPKMYMNDDLGINLLARNQFIRHIEGQLNLLWLIAREKTKTEEELRSDRKKDSTQ